MNPALLWDAFVYLRDEFKTERIKHICDKLNPYIIRNCPDLFTNHAIAIYPQIYNILINEQVRIDYDEGYLFMSALSKNKDMNNRLEIFWMAILADFVKDPALIAMYPEYMIENGELISTQRIFRLMKECWICDQKGDNMMVFSWEIDSRETNCTFDSMISNRLVLSRDFSYKYKFKEYSLDNAIKNFVQIREKISNYFTTHVDVMVLLHSKRTRRMPAKALKLFYFILANMIPQSLYLYFADIVGNDLVRQMVYKIPEIYLPKVLGYIVSDYLGVWIPFDDLLTLF
jgi:hypothetical protein